MDNFITIKGARANNLKGIDIAIPRNKLTVITGVSGSGKSSLAFDTLYAEGQRRFAESISSFSRQFLGRLSKPAVDSITGIPPAIAIGQKVNTSNPRSTVASSTDIYDYLKLLFAKIGKTYSPISGEEVKCDTAKSVCEYIISHKDCDYIYILTKIGSSRDGSLIEDLLTYKEDGYSRILISHNDGNPAQLLRIDQFLQDSANISYSNIWLLIDRVSPNDDDDNISRILDSVQSAFKVGNGEIYIHLNNQFKEFSSIFKADGIIFEEPNEMMFNFNNPLGACPKCGGFGKIVGIDESLVVPDPTLSIYEDAIMCWRGEVMKKFKEELIMSAYKFDFPIHKPYNQLTKEQKDTLWNGNDFFVGITPFFNWVEENRYKIQYKYLLARYSGKTTCSECEGSRLRKEASWVKIGGKNIGEIMSMSISDLYDFFKNLELDQYDYTVGKKAIDEILLRLEYIISVGLSYLTLDRRSNTLSGGESQRINLVSSLGNNLVGALYILDEPSVGLHNRDTQRLISVLKKLRDLGNTVVVVEHDEQIIRSADYLIDIGPRAGINGGEIVYNGDVNGYLEKLSKGEADRSESANSLTIDYLSGIRSINFGSKRRKWSTSIDIIGAMHNNLKNIDVKFPLHCITVVTGVSGSGKSSLVGDTLYPALNRHINMVGDKPGLMKRLDGDLDKITSVEYVDQNPIGKSARSNPVTYLKVYDDIRKIFSDQPYAKMNNYGHSHFSFNIDGGRCPECQGEGIIRVEMQFMADVVMPCSACNGKRFLPDILEVKYKGKSISDVLDMSVDDAIDFFSAQKEPLAKRIAEKLQPLQDVGLSYVKLGQSSSSFSGGESQRVKLAYFLGKENSSKRENILFIFDEPTTGLHFHDINKLLTSFNALVDKGHTIIVVEHNLDVIKSADWEIELGPDAGANGGEIVYQGAPRE